MLDNVKQFSVQNKPQAGLNRKIWELNIVRCPSMCEFFLFLMCPLLARNVSLSMKLILDWGFENATKENNANQLEKYSHKQVYTIIWT